MIKKIIFDVDDTLIEFPKNYETWYKMIIDKFDLNITPKELYKAIGKYELDFENIFYTKERFLNVVNKALGLSLNMDFVDEFLSVYKDCVTPVSNKVKDTLKYLSSKYELVVLSNWFTESQQMRLKKVGILQYFSKVYGTDILPMKPRKDGFLEIVGSLNPSECLMIGDNLSMDIKIPFELGMQVYHLSKFDNNGYPTIKNIEDLKEML